MKREYLEFSVIYTAFLASLCLYYGVAEVFASLFNIPYLFLLSLFAVYPLLLWRDFHNRILLVVLVFLMSAVALLLTSHTSVPGDVVGGLSLLLVSALLFYSLRDTLRELYSGLSFYIVGLFLLLAIGLLQILILLADIMDYYILCVGESCAPYPFSMRPEYALFFLGLLSLYPFLHRWEFRRKSE